MVTKLRRILGKDAEMFKFASIMGKTKMMDRNTIEQAYAFFHQKLKVYEHSTSEKEMDHIEDCIANYSNAMSKELFTELSGGNPAFLHEHTAFQNDLMKAVTEMENWLEFH